MGFIYHESLDKWIRGFSFLLSFKTRTDLNESPIEKISKIMSSLNVSSSSYKVGASQILIQKPSTLQILNSVHGVFRVAMVRKIQKKWRKVAGAKLKKVRSHPLTREEAATIIFRAWKSLKAIHFLLKIRRTYRLNPYSEY